MPFRSGWFACAIAPCRIRVLKDVDELIASYRLRYEVYGALGYLRATNRSQLEIDEYDRFAVPFGAFDGVSGALIGTLRLIRNHLQDAYVAAINHILSDLADIELTLQAMQPRCHPLPSVISDETLRRLEAWKRGSRLIQELSRTIVRSEHRGLGASRALMEFGIAHAAFGEPSILVGGCLPPHVPMYARYGYQRLPGTDLNHFDSVGQVAQTVVCDTEALPEPTRTHVDQQLRYMRSGAMECFFDGHESTAAFHFSYDSEAILGNG